MVTVGSIFGISKKNLSPLSRLNPYVTTDPETQTVEPHPTLNPLVDRLHMLLTMADNTGEIIEGDEEDEDESEESIDNAQES